MSLVYRTDQRTDLKQRDYSFILALVCMALAVVVAGIVFTPVAIGAGTASEITSVGP